MTAHHQEEGRARSGSSSLVFSSGPAVTAPSVWEWVRESPGTYMFAMSSISFALSSVTITTREFVAR
jgi:hypothetical protein